MQKLASMRLIDEALQIGAKIVLVPECGHAYPAMRWDARLDDGQPLPFEVMAVSEYVGQQIQNGNLKLTRGDPSHRVTYHDACKLARHGGVMTEPRTALKALGVDFVDTVPTAEQNWCCGGGQAHS